MIDMYEHVKRTVRLSNVTFIAYGGTRLRLWLRLGHPAPREGL